MLYHKLLWQQLRFLILLSQLRQTSKYVVESLQENCQYVKLLRQHQILLSLQQVIMELILMSLAH